LYRRLGPTDRDPCSKHHDLRGVKPAVAARAAWLPLRCAGRGSSACARLTRNLRFSTRRRRASSWPKRPASWRHDSRRR